MPRRNNYTTECVICQTRVSNNDSDFYWHHHGDKSVCLDCYARQLIRRYIQKYGYSLSVCSTLNSYMKPEVIAMDIWNQAREPSTCITCGTRYTPIFSNDQMNHVRMCISLELRAFDSVTVDYLLEIIRDLKDSNRELEEEKVFLTKLNENLKLKLTFD